MKTALLKQLTALQAQVEGGHYPDTGICGDVFASVDGHLKMDEMYRLFALWPKWTGSLPFPVPHPSKTASDAYRDCHLWEGKYGKNRKELLAFCISELEKELMA